MIKLSSWRDKHEQMIGEHYLTFCTYLSALTSSICDGSFWSWCGCGMVANGCQCFLHVDVGWSGGWLLYHADSVDNKTRSCTRLVHRDHGSWWHDLVAQGFLDWRLRVRLLSCMPASAYWSRAMKSLKWKRSDSSCLNAQELLEWSYAKLRVDRVMLKLCKRRWGQS